jgi:hypothetical protein
MGRDWLRLSIHLRRSRLRRSAYHRVYGTHSRDFFKVFMPARTSKINDVEQEAAGQEFVNIFATVVRA